MTKLNGYKARGGFPSAAVSQPIVHRRKAKYVKTAAGFQPQPSNAISTNNTCSKPEEKNQ